jgi:hypothetical protein
MEQPQDIKTDKETDTVSAKYIPARAWVKTQINTLQGRQICNGKM